MDDKEQGAIDKSAEVHKMFSSIAKCYDILNTLLSFGVDHWWRREAVRAAIKGDTKRVLDVATGTADLAISLKRSKPDAEVIAVDFVVAMLEIARVKITKRKLDIHLEQADGLDLPYPNESFDVVTIAYGLRNFADYKQGLKEFYRVLKPFGRLVVLEFPPPPKGIFGQIFRWYFFRVVPFVGGLLSGKHNAYAYLPESVLAFPNPKMLAKLMYEVGFGKVEYKLQTFGISALHTANKV